MSNVRTDALGRKRRIVFTGLVAALVVSGCASATGTTSMTATTAAAQTAPAVTSAAVATRPRQRSHPPHRSHPTPSPSRGSGSLAYSTASNDRMQPQPAPGTCHAIGTGVYSRPDPRCTPGALNPAVTQSTIDRTICVAGWTAMVRPPENVTEQEKAASMAAYGDTGSMRSYEYDHFVPLELGGATNDPRNLWPEKRGLFGGAGAKDRLEDFLHRAVCSGRMSLRAAQVGIASDWFAMWVRLGRP